MLRVDGFLEQYYKDFINEVYRSLGKNPPFSVKAASVSEGLDTAELEADMFPGDSLFVLLSGLKSVFSGQQGKDAGGIGKFVEYLMGKFGADISGKGYTEGAFKSFIRLFGLLSIIRPHIKRNIKNISSGDGLDKTKAVKDFLRYMDFYEKINQGSGEKNFFVLPFFNPYNPDKDSRIVLWMERKGKGRKKIKTLSFAFRIGTVRMKDLYVQGDIRGRKVNLNITVETDDIKKRLEDGVGMLKNSLRSSSYTLGKVNFSIKGERKSKSTGTLEIIA